MAGCLGKDSFGETLLGVLDDENINRKNVKQSGSSTGVGFITVDKSGENRIIIVQGANLDFTLADVERIDYLIKDTEIVISQLELSMEVTELLGQKCKAYGKKFILNPAPATKLSEELLSSVTYLTPNETELSLLTGHTVNTIDDIELASRKLLELGVKNVIVTLGSKGALLINENECEHIFGYKVDAKDTVAAGDSFNGALAHQLCSGVSLVDAILYANAVGALTVQREGAIPSLPTKEVVEHFIKEHTTQRLSA